MGVKPSLASKKKNIGSVTYTELFNVYIFIQVLGIKRYLICIYMSHTFCIKDVVSVRCP